MDQPLTQNEPEATGLPEVWIGPAPPEEPGPIEKIKRAGEAREGFPGEHWLVLAIGIGLWQVTRRHRNVFVRTLGGLGASMLVARAATGRDGLARVLSYTPFGGRISRCPPCEAREDPPR